MSLPFSSSYFLEGPFLSDSFVTLSDLSKATMDAQDRLGDNLNSGNVSKINSSRREIIYIPRMDIHESKDKNEVTVTFELPGIKKEDLTIDIHQNRLTISGQNSSLIDLDQGGYIHRERRVGQFVRAVALPGGVKPADVKVRMEHGILIIRFPRSSAENTPKRFKLKDLAKL